MFRMFGFPKRSNQSSGIGCNPRIIIALLFVGITLFSYFRLRSHNPVTGETQHVDLTKDQEVMLGLQATAEMAAQFDGLLADQEVQLRIDDIGQRIVDRSDAVKGGYPFAFHVLADNETINAFALPGGQVFITNALLTKLTSDAEVAGVLGHEIAHVVGRHSAEHIAKQKLTQGLTGAAVIATYDPGNPSSQAAAMMAQMVQSMITLKYGRSDELESDELGVKFMAQAGYDPRAMVKVMQVLAEAGGPNRQPEFFSTHPNPDNRIERINAAIAALYPQGVPAELEK